MVDAFSLMYWLVLQYPLDYKEELKNQCLFINLY